MGLEVVISTFNCGYLSHIPFKFKGYHKYGHELKYKICSFEYEKYTALHCYLSVSTCCL